MSKRQRSNGFANLERLLVISPHLDDAVFGCGQLLAKRPGAVVATIFAGVPRRRRAVTPWDRACGFTTAQEAVACRRAEDQAALDVLGARAIWLRFLDSQYESTPARESIAAKLRDVVHREIPDAVLLPLGLFHTDHELAHDACLDVRRDAASVPCWIAYEDALYRRHRGLLQKRLAGLLDEGVIATPIPAPAGAGRKAEAVRCYRSQLRAFSPATLADTSSPERFWRLDDA